VSPDDSFGAFLEEHRATIEAALERFLPRAPGCPALLRDALAYSLTAGGKRLRPILALTAADAVARRLLSDSAQTLALTLPAACAIEFIHTYSLIHDDLPAMDNDTLRRGRPTLHTVYGDGVAILAGDALQAEAFALLAREPHDDDGTLAVRKLRVIQQIAEAAGAAGMVGGQAIDLQAAGQVTGQTLALDGAALEGMHLRKTGALIRASAVSGAIMAGGDEGVVDAVARWAEQVGLAFQIVDDILDVQGSAGELGKTAGKDAASDKPTYPSLFGLDRARDLADACLARSRTILAEANLTQGRLDAIAGWVITRRR
jgi:geranylgeranyl diphosphate synthase type II